MNKRQQYRAGMSAYNAGHYAEAAEHLTPLIAGERGATALLSRFYAAQANYRLAVELFRCARFGEAAERFQAAARANPDSGGFAPYLAACHLKARRFDLAVQELEQMLAQSPGDVSLRIRLALAHWKQGNRFEAAAILRQGMEGGVENAELHYQLGLVLSGQDELDEAERHFERAIAIDPRHAGAFERLAQCCSLKKRHERALRYLEQAHRIDPGNRRILWQLSLLAQSMPGVLTTGISCQSQQQLSRKEATALERLGELIIAEPDFVHALLSVPESEVDEEVFSTVAAILEEALRKHPEFADLHYHCGVVYRRLGRSQDAIQHAEEAVRLNPRYVNALVLLAQLYGQTDRLAAGIERLEQALATGCNFPDVHYMVGQLYQSAGEVGRAREAYQRALELNREYQAAKDALVALAA